MKLVENFKLLCQVRTVKNRNRVRRLRTTGNIAAVARSVRKTDLSTSHRSVELDISQTTLHCILLTNVSLKA